MPKVSEDVEQLMLDWPLYKLLTLKPGMRALIVGAYQGKVMELLATQQPEYKEIVGYEPQTWAHERAQTRMVLGGFQNCPVYPYGLGLVTNIEPMGEYHTDAASFINTGSREQGSGLLVNANQELSRLLGDDERIDLMIMNIEGYEFKLLPFLREAGWLERIDEIAVQWHLFHSEPMDAEIAKLGASGFYLVVDERPTWTLHRR